MENKENAYPYVTRTKERSASKRVPLAVLYDVCEYESITEKLDKLCIHRGEKLLSTSAESKEFNGKLSDFKSMKSDAKPAATDEEFIQFDVKTLKKGAAVKEIPSNLGKKFVLREKLKNVSIRM
ncbi:hypothetical protein CDAR_402861 [Caerostris darwini]|uniref:Uncharacterized protein n=1 Tax=Caerostris darwini TaxID=1538125 RepID=A0AAV4QZ78_9ARAC|nr:hypothetical protein CDAR_402861 [Caerostris darwini]